MIVDSAFTTTRHYNRLTETRHIGGDIVQITVHHDGYEDQSYARAHVLSDDKKWTQLAETPKQSWFRHPELRSDLQPVFADIAADLAVRAEKILTRQL